MQFYQCILSTRASVLGPENEILALFNLEHERIFGKGSIQKQFEMIRAWNLSRECVVALIDPDKIIKVDGRLFYDG